MEVINLAIAFGILSGSPANPLMAGAAEQSVAPRFVGKVRFARPLALCFCLVAVLYVFSAIAKNRTRNLLQCHACGAGDALHTLAQIWHTWCAKVCFQMQNNALHRET